MNLKGFQEADLIDWGRQVVETEARAMLNAAKKLDSNFSNACQRILSIKGKLVITGLGKSGHVGRKLAATLTSTGTIACYLHPTEALHGDLGLLSRHDLLIAIAFGGETREVVNVARFAKRKGVPVIAISGKVASTLASLADYLIDASVHSEACPLNLAPTSSSTVALALGDALAVALMTAKGFSNLDFAEIHPGGSLGTKLSPVSEYLRNYNRDDLIFSDFRFGEILEKITRNNYGIAPVVTNEMKLIGCISDGDIRRSVQRLQSGVFECCALSLMSKSPKTTSLESLAVDAIRIMEENKITALFVVSAQHMIVGVVRLHDLLSAKIV